MYFGPLRSSLERWCNEEGWVSIAEAVEVAAAGLGLSLDVRPPGSADIDPVRMSVRQPAGTDRLVVACRIPEPSELAGMMRSAPEELRAEVTALFRTLLLRPGFLDCVPVDAGGGAREFELSLTLWLDGLNKHTFLTALVEMSRSREIVLDSFRRIRQAAVLPDGR
jgi:hypothetical protein